MEMEKKNIQMLSSLLRGNGIEMGYFFARLWFVMVLMAITFRSKHEFSQNKNAYDEWWEIQQKQKDINENIFRVILFDMSDKQER